MTILSSIIPARFLVTIGHLIATIMAFLTKDSNIMSALPISSTLDYRAFEQSLVAALILTWILFVIEFSGLLSGRTMFCTASSTIHIVAHAAGMISLSLFMTEGWHYITYWYIFIFCSLLPGAIEMGILAFQHI